MIIIKAEELPCMRDSLASHLPSFSDTPCGRDDCMESS
jgi:hypothetical protein